jgi:hypothetical protein
MATLSLVSFVLWATGLCAATLAALMAYDGYAARHARGAAATPPHARIPPAGSPAVQLQPPLRKAA